MPTDDIDPTVTPVMPGAVAGRFSVRSRTGESVANRSPVGTASTAVMPLIVVVPWLRIWALMVYVSPIRQIS